MTIRFLKPRKLGVSAESWLKHEVRFFECTAATWQSFKGVDSFILNEMVYPLLKFEVSGMTESLVRAALGT